MGLDAEMLDVQERTFKSAFGEHRSGKRLRVPTGSGGTRDEVIRSSGEAHRLSGRPTVGWTLLVISLSAQKKLRIENFTQKTGFRTFECFAEGFFFTRPVLILRCAWTFGPTSVAAPTMRPRTRKKTTAGRRRV